MNIFLSYGHDEYDKFAYRLKQDLESNGFKVWMDVNRIKGTSDWEKEIESGINGSDWFVIIMTQHSCRRPDGVCLDEVSYARLLGKSIAPIMVENVRPPLCIARIQYIDMENYFKPGEVKFDEESYQKKFNILLNVLLGIEKISHEGEYEILRNRLVPLDNDVYYGHFRHNFYGRDKLFSYYRKWISSSSNLLWIVGNAGVGKTAFIAKLTENNKEIKAVHFCKYNDSDRANPKRAIMSIAYYLSTQLDEYKNILLELHDLDNLQEKSTERLFAYLLAEPLNKIEKQVETSVIVIDALDESTCEGRNELVDILSSRHAILPSWIKIIITSRDEPILRRKLSKIRPISFDDEHFANNRDDIRGYFEMCLKDIKVHNKEKIIQSLLEKSAGSFLYAKTIMDDIFSGVLPIDEYEQFPNGLTGIYTSYFDRLFKYGKCDYRHDIRPLLEILCSEYSPICSDDILHILDIDEYDFDDIKEEIAQMFPERDGIIEPIHKSIVDWLISREKSGTYRVSLNKGHKKLAEYCTGMIIKHSVTEYALKYATRHLINAEMYDRAIDLLNNQKFQDRRINFLGLDTAFREYLYEISSLVSIGINVEKEIYKKKTFLHYFVVYRKFLYNTGLFLYLRDNGFDNILQSENLCLDSNVAVAIANYFYIVEKFDCAIKVIEKIFDSGNIINEYALELKNILGLCYRKYVKFDLARNNFEQILESNLDDNNLYEKSGAAMNLGKICYHELDWHKAMLYNKEGIFILNKAYDKSDNADERITLELFIAEYYRLTAECLIWNLDISEAGKFLNLAQNIYNKTLYKDRYYVRFLYTSALLNIFGGDPDTGLLLCDKVSEIAVSQYDQSQVLFYKGIALLMKNKRQAALKCAIKGIEKTEQIGAWLELEEITLIKNIAEEHIVINHTACYYDNRYIHVWSDYVIEMIERLIK